MKNLLKIGALSLALIASLFLLNQTNAIDGDVRLELTEMTGSCVYGTSLFIGTSGVSFDSFNMTGENFKDGASDQAFYCVDTEGIDTWVMTMEASSDLANATSQTIPQENVSMIAATNDVTAGSCTTGANDDSWVGIGMTGGVILNKASAVGDICTITSDYVNLAVEIPANQAVGYYTGDLLLTMPF